MDRLDLGVAVAGGGQGQRLALVLAERGEHALRLPCLDYELDRVRVADQIGDRDGLARNAIGRAPLEVVGERLAAQLSQQPEDLVASDGTQPANYRSRPGLAAAAARRRA